MVDMIPFPNKKYQVIYADPPWPLKKIKLRVRPNQGELSYPTMRLDEIRKLPVSEISDENSHLFLWTTHKFLPDAFVVMKDWGFKYHNTITWDKMNGLALCGFKRRTEFLLYGYNGKIDVFPKRKCIPTIFTISSRKLMHSEKPMQIREQIEVLGDKRIELFARQRFSGWDAWGNEV